MSKRRHHSPRPRENARRSLRRTSKVIKNRRQTTLLKRTSENKNDENDDIRNKFSKTASNNPLGAGLKKPLPKPPSVNKKFGAPEKEKTIFKLNADAGLKEIKTKPKSIASFFAPVKKK